MWTPTPPLAGRRTPRLGPRACVCVLTCPGRLAGSGGPASRARFGAPHFSFGRVGVFLSFFGPLHVGFAMVFFFGPPLCPAFCVSGPGYPGPWSRVVWFFSGCAVSSVLCFVPPSLRFSLLRFPPRLCLWAFFFFFFAPGVSGISVVSGPGSPGPWRCVVGLAFPCAVCSAPRRAALRPYFVPVFFAVSPPTPPLFFRLCVGAGVVCFSAAPPPPWVPAWCGSDYGCPWPRRSGALFPFLTPSSPFSLVPSSSGVVCFRPRVPLAVAPGCTVSLLPPPLFSPPPRGCGPGRRVPSWVFVWAVWCCVSRCAVLVCWRLAVGAALCCVVGCVDGCRAPFLLLLCGALVRRAAWCSVVPRGRALCVVLWWAGLACLCVAVRCGVVPCLAVLFVLSRPVACCCVLCRWRCYQKAMAGMSTHGYR